MLSVEGRGGSVAEHRASTVLAVCWALALFLAGPPSLDAQLVVENSSRKWRAGEYAELLVRGRDARSGARIEEVKLNGLPIDFELIDPGTDDEPIRIRIRVPRSIRPGQHQVSVRFSEVSRSTTVPEVRGLALDEARRRLTAAGLSARTRGDSIVPPAGAFLAVVSQSPAPGARLARAGRVTIDVASSSRVPNIVGLDAEAAERELARSALELALPNDLTPRPELRVESQVPAAGALVAAPSAVRVEASATVPSLVGMDAEEARRLLSSLGLRWQARFIDPIGAPYRTVVGQDPAAGFGVEVDSAVAVIFESLPDPAPLSWPWAWTATAVGLGASLGVKKVRIRRPKRGYEIRVTNDLERLRRQAKPPAWADKKPRLDVRLTAVADRGRQTIEVAGPLIAS